MSGIEFRPEAGSGLLPHTSLRPERTHRHPVVGLLLDQRGRLAGSGLHRAPDRAHDHHDEQRGEIDPAEGVLHQSNRRVDDCLPGVRLYLAYRICGCERAGKEGAKAAQGQPVIIETTWGGMYATATGLHCVLLSFGNFIGAFLVGVGYSVAHKPRYYHITTGPD